MPHGTANPPLSVAAALELAHLDNEGAAVNGVDDDPSARERVVAPSSVVPDGGAATLLVVIRRVHVEVSNLLDVLARWLLGDGGHVVDAEAGLVVGLVCETRVHKLVVVDGLDCSLVVAGVDGLLQVGDVEDVSGGVAVESGRLRVGALRVDDTLVDLVVEEEMGLPVQVENPSLVRVGSTLVGCARDDGGGLRACLVGDVVDGQRVLVVAVADIAAVVFLVRASVDNALRVMHVAVLRSATFRVGLGRVVHVDEDETRRTRRRARLGTDCHCIVKLFVYHNVVGTANRKIGEQASEIFRCIENHWLLGVNLQQLLHIEDLNAVSNSLTANDQVIAVGLDLSPDDWVSLRGQTSQIHQFTLLSDFSESSTVGLTDGNEITPFVAPTPRSRALTAIASELLVRLEVVHVDVLALVSLVRVALDSFSDTILALDDVLAVTFLVKSVPLLVVVVASGFVGSPGGLVLLALRRMVNTRNVAYLFS